MGFQNRNFSSPVGGNMGGTMGGYGGPAPMGNFGGGQMGAMNNFGGGFNRGGMMNGGMRGGIPNRGGRGGSMGMNMGGMSMPMGGNMMGMGGNMMGMGGNMGMMGGMGRFSVVHTCNAPFQNSLSEQTLIISLSQVLQADLVAPNHTSTLLSSTRLSSKAVMVTGTLMVQNGPGRNERTY